MTLAGGERRKVSFEFTAGGTGDGREHFQWHHGPMLWSIQTRVLVNGEIRFTENHDCTIYKKEFPALVLDAPVALLDLSGEARSASSQALAKLQVAHTVVSEAAAVRYPESAILVIAEDALAKLDLALIRPKLMEFTAAGGWVVCLEQDEFPSGWLPLNLQPDQADLSRRATMVQPIDPSHPALAGLAAEDFRFWRGDHYVTRQNLVKPAEGNFRPILAYGNGSTPYVDRTPLLEVLNGRGGYLLCQALVVEKFDAEPVASRLLANLLMYVRRRQMQPADGLNESLALILPASEMGKRDWLESLGAKVEVVAPKAAQDLGAYKVAAVVLAKGFPEAPASQALQQWVRDGGKLLVLGLTADLTAEGASFCQAPTRLLKRRLWTTSTDAVVKCRSDELTLGLSNADLCWEGKALVPEQFARLDGAMVSDLTSDPLLQKVEQGKGVLLVSQLPLAAEKDSEPSRRTTSILLTNLGVGLSPKVFAARTAREEHFPVDTRNACNMGFRDDKAGDGKGGWTDQGENDLRNFPVGKRTFCGVTFDIIDPATNDGKSCIVLKGKNAPALPLQSALIDAGNRKWDRIWFLHGGGYIGSGRQAYYRVKYTDWVPPESLEVPVSVGDGIADWWAPPANLPNGLAAWTGENLVRGAGGVSVYLMAWKNPFPERAIQSIQMISDVDGTVGLIGITGVKVAHKMPTEEQPTGPEQTMGHTIRIDASDLKADPDGTLHYHDGYAPLQACRDATGDEAAGGPVYARFWRRTYATSNLRVFWQYNGSLSYLAADAWRKDGRAASFTLKYQLPPERAFERGAARCKFDYWHNGRAEGCLAAILVSNDNQNWIEVVRFTGGKEEHWTNAPKAAKDSQEYPGTKCPLPKEIRGWQTLYVKCLIDGEAAPQASNHDIQMVRENWGEKDERYALDLVVR